MNQVVKKSPAVTRDYAIFDADISGAVLNMQLLRRLLRWLAPYKVQLFLSTVLVLLASTLQILLPIIISLVVIDHVLRNESSTDTPDFGMIEFNESLAGTLDISPLLAALASSRSRGAPAAALARRRDPVVAPAARGQPGGPVARARAR